MAIDQPNDRQRARMTELAWHLGCKPARDRLIANFKICVDTDIQQRNLVLSFDHHQATCAISVLCKQHSDLERLLPSVHESTHVFITAELLRINTELEQWFTTLRLNSQQRDMILFCLKYY
jgi:hypothetical protein